MKTSTSRKKRKKYSAWQPILCFEGTVPVYSLKPRSVNSLFRLAHCALFQKPLPFKPN